MTGVTVGFDETEEVLTFEVSDEALEIAAGVGDALAGPYTLYFCTALALCPGP
jgi:hypothetical protein